jgi:protocatechuate 3,4-dioxygenase beta subunit
VERPDAGAGDFDMIFNYDKVLWETGDASGGSGGLGGSPARMGYSNGTTTAFEQPGSGQTGAFLNSNTNTGLIHNSRNSTQLGRYIFPVRNGNAPVGATVNGTVASGAGGVAGALVQLCGGGFCNLTSTGGAGAYAFTGVSPGTYQITANPPSGTMLNQGSAGPVMVGTANVTAPPILLSGPQPPPAGTTITNRYINAAGIPVIYWNDPLTLTTTGCAGGTATYEVRRAGAVIRSGGMAEGPAGTYTATIAPLFPNSGYAQVVISITCGGVTTTTQFDIYIDPSGHVRTVGGQPIGGATVTLYRSDAAGGPFAIVPNGSAIMSPGNRNNPDTTDANGRFGWDVITGFYRVRASAQGCVSPNDPAVGFVESAVLTIPPPVTDLDLRLSCAQTNQPPTADAGGPYEVAEGSSVLLAGSGSDPDQDPLSFAWDLDGNGSFETPGQSGTFSAAAIDGPAGRTATLQVCDDQNACATAEAIVNVLNAAPVISQVTNSGPVDEGSSATIHVTATDPAGAADLLAYAFDCDGDGTYEVGPQPSGSVSCPYDDGSVGVEVTVSVTDDDGGSTTGTTVVHVNNVAPTASASNDGPNFWGLPITLTGSATDPSDADTQAGFTGAWAFGDATTGTGMSTQHVYAIPGTYTASFTARDKDNATSDPATTVVVVNRRPTSLSCADASTTFGFPVSFSHVIRDEATNTTITIGNILWFVDGEAAAGGVSPRTAMPGAHVVTARFPGDPRYAESVATCQLTVTNSLGKVTGGGRTPTDGRGGFNAINDPVEGMSGELQFQTELTKFHAHRITALGISADKTEAWFAGVGDHGRAFVAGLKDMGEPGVDDVMTLWIAGILQNGDGAVLAGNVQIH